MKKVGKSFIAKPTIVHYLVTPGYGYFRHAINAIPMFQKPPPCNKYLSLVINTS